MRHWPKKSHVPQLNLDAMTDVLVVRFSRDPDRFFDQWSLPLGIAVGIETQPRDHTAPYVGSSMKRRAASFSWSGDGTGAIDFCKAMRTPLG